MTANDFERTMSSSPGPSPYPGIQHRLAPSMAFWLAKMVDCGMIHQQSVQEPDIRLVQSSSIHVAFLGSNSSILCFELYVFSAN